MDYDLIVIGAGPGGYVCAIRASQLGKKVAIVDREWLGGVCLNIGCIPSKSLLKNAEITHTILNRAEEFGFSYENLHVDYSVAVKRSRGTATRLTKGVNFLMKKNGIDVHIGTAYLKSKSSVHVTDAKGEVSNLTASNIVIAAGAQPASPGHLSNDGKRVITYREAILQEHLPKSVVIVGGGAIGVEFATIWSSYGSQVTLIEMLPRILPMEDEQISAELTESFHRRGIKIITHAKVEQVETESQKVKVTIKAEKGIQSVSAEQVLIATGFVPNSNNLGLDELGVECDNRGFIKVDARARTNLDGVFAVGDITGKLLLAHVASAQGVVAAETIAGEPTIDLNYRMMPRATYCHPEVASFGYTEVEAREAGHQPKTARFNFQANGKALGIGEYGGWAKIISDEVSGEIIGAHMIGPQVTELLPELTLAQNMELTGAEIARNVHAHPTLSEVVAEAAHGLMGEIIPA